jgi:hypothetical protein
MIGLYYYHSLQTRHQTCPNMDEPSIKWQLLLADNRGTSGILQEAEPAAGIDSLRVLENQPCGVTF